MACVLAQNIQVKVTVKMFAKIQIQKVVIQVGPSTLWSFWIFLVQFVSANVEKEEKSLKWEKNPMMFRLGVLLK